MPHLRGSKDKGRDDGWNPAIAEVKDDEPGNALHDDEVGQEQEEEQVVALEQVHVLGRLPQGPEVLSDLGLRSERTGKASATSHHGRQRLSSPRACLGLAQSWDCAFVHSQLVKWQRKDWTRKPAFCTAVFSAASFTIGRRQNRADTADGCVLKQGGSVRTVD